MRRALLAALFAGLVLAPAAPAAEKALVAGPVDGGRLLAHDEEDGTLCLELRASQVETGSCGVGDPLTAWDTRSGGATGKTTSWWYAAVVPDVAAIELAFTDGTATRSDTSAGEAYHGAAAGRVRFALAAYPSGRRLRIVRLFDATGTEIAAVEPDSFPISFGPPPGARVLHRFGRFALRGFRERYLAPTPIEPERFEHRRCVTITTRDDPSGSGAVCNDRSSLPSRRLLTVSPGGGCESLDIVGLARPGVRRVVLVLGDGSRRRLETYAGDVLPGLRAFATVLSGDEAVRRAIGLDAAGRRIAGSGFAIAPAQAPCPPPEGESFVGGFSSFAFAFGGGAERTIGAADPVLVAEDRGDLLCAGPGHIERRDCQLPPLRPYESRLIGVRGAGRTVIAGVLPQRADRLTLVLDGGERRVVRPGPSPAYAGRYAGHVGFVALELKGARDVLAAHVRFRGRRFPSFVLGLDPRPGPSRTVLSAHGLRLRVAATAGFPHDTVCVRFAGASCLGRSTFLVKVRCGARGGTFVAGLMPPRARRLVAVLDGGEHVRARVRPLPRDLPRRGRAWLLVLRPDQALERLITVGPGGQRAWQRLPPSSEQCGYDSFGGLFAPFVF